VEVTTAPASTEAALKKCTEPGDGAGSSNLPPIAEEEELSQCPGKAHVEASKDVVTKTPVAEDEPNVSRDEASIFRDLDDIFVTSEELFQDITPVSRPTVSIVEVSFVPSSIPLTDVLVSATKAIATPQLQSGSLFDARKLHTPHALRNFHAFVHALCCLAPALFYSKSF